MASEANLSTTPLNTDTQRILEVRILNALRGIGGGGGGGGSGTGQSGITGIGSPEGVVTANPGTVYFDQAGDSLWLKESGNGNTGWIQLIA